MPHGLISQTFCVTVFLAQLCCIMLKTIIKTLTLKILLYFNIKRLCLLLTQLLLGTLT
jgi:hypothetical protein